MPPLPFAVVPIERLRSDGALVVTVGNERGVLELPKWVADVLEALPISEAFSGPDGTFVVYGVDPGEVVVAELLEVHAGRRLRADLRRRVGAR